MLDVTRTEKKYDIGPLEMADMKRRLGVFMDSDPHNGEKGYLVRSLYFDTLSDTDFEEKVEGYDEKTEDTSAGLQHRRADGQARGEGKNGWLPAEAFADSEQG